MKFHENKRGVLCCAFVCWFVVIAATAPGARAYAESYSDPEGLITFAVPDSWTLQSESRGMRFRRAVEKERSILSVTPKRASDATDLESLRATRLSQVRSQSRNVLTDSVRGENGITIWEFVVEPGSDGRGPISHSIHLFTDSLHIEVLLIAMPDRYLEYQGDLVSVVDSVAGQF